jgi:hypothetical protein
MPRRGNTFMMLKRSISSRWLSASSHCSWNRNWVFQREKKDCIFGGWEAIQSKKGVSPRRERSVPTILFSSYNKCKILWQGVSRYNQERESVHEARIREIEDEATSRKTCYPPVKKMKSQMGSKVIMQTPHNCAAGRTSWLSAMVVVGGGDFID